MQAIEHFLESGARDESQNISLSHHVVCSTNIKRNYFAIQLYHCCNLSLIFLPLLSFLLNFSLFRIKLLLHLQMESLKEFMVGDELVPDTIVFECPVIEQVIDLRDVVCKNLLDLFDARSPDTLHIADA